MLCPFVISIPRPHGVGNSDRITVPCGKCYACLTNRRVSWTIRLTEESKKWDNCIFLSLTYDENNLCLNCDGVGTIIKDDLQRFFKRLRKKLHRKIKYFAVGEYGTTTLRPHYHAIIFNCYESDYSAIDSAWGIGFVSIGKVTPASIMYVTKYHLNKTDYPSNTEQPFCLVSKGMGLNYVEKMKDYHEGKIRTGFYQDYELKKALPRYYKEKIFTKEEISEMGSIQRSKSDVNLVREIEEFKRKHPFDNFFKFKQSEELTRQKLFKQKSNLNNKL